MDSLVDKWGGVVQLSKKKQMRSTSRLELYSDPFTVTVFFLVTNMYVATHVSS